MRRWLASVVIGTGAATLAAFIDAGGLGEAIISGLSVQNYAETLTGAVPAALLAIVSHDEEFLENVGVEGRIMMG